MARGRGVCLRSTSARSRLHRGSLSRAERVVLEVELVEAAKGGRVRVHAECVEVEVVRRGAHLLEDVLQRDRLAVRRVRHHLVRRDAALLLDEAEQVPTATRARSLTDASRDVLSSSPRGRRRFWFIAAARWMCVSTCGVRGVAGVSSRGCGGAGAELCGRFLEGS